ncbi:MAG: hypothetical protein LC667_10180 [Thioalkalivibrio sp.]|nr:hypothetical protein [Thioalkalivibrio sp.]
MYEQFDGALRSWANTRALHVATKYRDEEVRSIELVNQTGKRAEIWLSLTTAGAGVTVHAWDFESRRWSRSASAGSLAAELENAYAEVQRWWAAPVAVV